MSSANSKDLTDADYDDRQRENIAKERAATSAQKEFTPHFEYLVPDSVNIDDASTADDDTAANPETIEITDHDSDYILQGGRYRFGGGMRTFDPDLSGKIRSFAGKPLHGREQLYFGFGVFKA